MKLITLSLLVTGLAGLGWTVTEMQSRAPVDRPAVRYDSDFWSHWSDGNAEIASYDLEFSRYGIVRSGTAVTIFVTEEFNELEMVKADGRVDASDKFPVLKLNLVQDYPTGIYDYNTMNSVFVALAARDGRPSGAVAKIAFGSQEWCGHTYHQLVYRGNSVEETVHSYFGGEADQQRTFDDDGALTEDELFHWARGFTGPRLAAGESVNVSLFRSLESARLEHRDVDRRFATLSRSETSLKLTVPAGEFDCDRYRCEIEGHRDWEFFVETAAPHRIVSWQASDGRTARLVASDRLAYWNMNGPAGVKMLEKIGLRARPRRTP